MIRPGHAYGITTSVVAGWRTPVPRHLALEVRAATSDRQGYGTPSTTTSGEARRRQPPPAMSLRPAADISVK